MYNIIVTNSTDATVGKTRQSILGKVSNFHAKLTSCTFSKFLRLNEESASCILKYKSFKDLAHLIRNRKYKFILFILKHVYTIDSVNGFSIIFSYFVT